MNFQRNNFFLPLALVLLFVLPGMSQVVAAYPPILSGGGGQMYLESLYLPPITTGPWAPAWSPDGRQIVFSARGSLWKVAVEGGEAVQITSGPDYDSEPTWSPSGKQIAFTRDTGHTIEIWAVDDDGGNPRQLTQGRAMSVDPEWSPSGAEVLYASSAGAKSFGFWTVSAQGGRPQSVLTDEFQNLEPSWSPDGTAFVFLSNRGGREATGQTGARRQVYGSGDFWRLELADKGLRLLLREETSYHARPKWSPDGKKIVFVSHRTGHNELWVMHADTGISTQLTRQDAEVFTPRWSRDGQRIAYISNAGGAFTLRIIPAEGGTGSEVKITAWKYRAPVGTLRVVVRDKQTGRETPARVYVRAADGKGYAPSGGFHRHSVVTDDHYFHTAGSFSVELPAGMASVEVMKGFEYRPQKKETRIAPGATQTVEFALERLADLAAQGWYSGDTHLHMNYAGIFDATPKTLLLEAEAEDLNVVNDHVTNNSNRLIDLQYFEGRPHPLSTPKRILYFNEEFRPNFGGHMGLLNLKQYFFPVYNGYGGTPYAADYPANSQVLDRIHAQGAIGGYVHPYFVARGQDPAAQDYFGAREFPVSAALKKVDYYDLMCIFSDEYVAAEVWYRLLNLGFRIPIAAGTDAMTNYWRAPAIGTVRVYAHTGPDLTYEGWIRALTAGRTFVTDGPLLFLRVEGREPGEELRLSGSGPASARVEAEAVSILPMQTLDILQNGRVVFSVKAEDPYRVKLSTSVPVERSGWVAARVTGPEKQHLLMDSYVYAHTGPVYLRRGEQAARSPEDAKYFLKWIDRVMELMEKRNAFDTPAQKEEVFGLWRKARNVYAELSKD